MARKDWLAALAEINDFRETHRGCPDLCFESPLDPPGYFARDGAVRFGVNGDATTTCIVAWCAACEAVMCRSFDETAAGPALFNLGFSLGSPGEPLRVH